jgi:hypothetical protein
MAATHTRPAGLNVFARAMLAWNDLHPYNAVHVLRFSGTADLPRLRAVLTQRLNRHGLSSLQIDRRRGTYLYGGQPQPVAVKVLSTPGGDPLAVLADETTRQLNLPFESAATFCPFRFFLINQQDGFLLGTAYFHPIADAQSVSLLLRELAEDYGTGRMPGTEDALECHPPRHDRLGASCSVTTARKLLSLPSDIRTMRRSHRTPLHDAGDLSNDVRFTRVGSRTLDHLSRVARTWGVTLHDLLLALLMQAMAPLAPERESEPRRRNLSIGTIVNTRQDHGMEAPGMFGLFLGSFVVSHPVPDGVRLQALATDVHRQTARIKRRKLYLTTSLDLRVAGAVMSLCSTTGKKRFYHKHHPLWGGITNMNMNRLWPQGDNRPLDYLRAVSTGPVTPLVLSVTTFDDHMSLGLSYRPAVYDAPQMDRLQAALERHFKALEAC